MKKNLNLLLKIFGTTTPKEKDVDFAFHSSIYVIGVVLYVYYFVGFLLVGIVLFVSIVGSIYLLYIAELKKK